MSSDMLKVCDAVFAAGLNGVWQGMLVTLGVALALRVRRRTNAATRHAVWFLTLLLVTALLAAHCLIAALGLPIHTATNGEAAAPHRVNLTQPAAAAAGRAEMPAARSAAPNATHQAPDQGTRPKMRPSDHPSSDGALYAAPDPFVVVLSAVDPPVVAPSIGVRSSLAEPAASSSVPSQAAPEMAGEPVGWLATPQAVPGAPAFASAGAATGEGRPWPTGRWLQPLSLSVALDAPIPAYSSLAILALWLVVAGIRLAVLALRCGRLHALKREAVAPSAELERLFRKLLADVRPDRRVQLKISPAQRSCLLLGFVDPVIILPARPELAPQEAELVLQHELAHVRRWDDWANLLQHVILAAFPFHPALEWISRQMSLEREIACDDHVLQQSRRPRVYALLLADLASRMQARPLALAPGASNNRTQLQQRIAMILDRNRNNSPRLARASAGLIASAAALLTLATLAAAPRVVFAHVEPGPGSSTTAPAAPRSAEGPASAASTTGVATEPTPDVGPRSTPNPVGRLSSTSSAGNAAASGPDPGARSTTAVPGISAEPKSKPGVTPELPPPNRAPTGRAPDGRAPAAPPAPPAAPAPAAVPVPAAVLAVPAVPPVPALAAAEPLPERGPGARPFSPRVRGPGTSIEERLNRLEHMVESLMTRQGHAPDRKPTEASPGFPGTPGKHDPADKARGLYDPGATLHFPDKQKIKEQAEREIARSLGRGKAAMAPTGMAMPSEQKRHARHDFQKQLETLRIQREALDRELERLERHIEQLESRREAMDEEIEKELDDGAAQPGAEGKATPPVRR